MIPHPPRAIHFLDRKGQAELAVAIERLLPRAAAQLETTSLYLLLAVLWGIVFFVALTQAL